MNTLLALKSFDRAALYACPIPEGQVVILEQEMCWPTPIKFKLGSRGSKPPKTLFRGNKKADHTFFVGHLV